MSPAFVGIILLLAAVYVVAVVAVSHRRAQLRVVHCPATGGRATLQLEGAGLLLARRPRVKDCSLWPEPRFCAQACLAEIESSPEECAFHRILGHWYLGRVCAFCRRQIAPVRWGEIRPALLAPDGRVLTWSDIAPAAVYDVLSTHQPVCANCGVAESFRRRYPDLVVDRPRDTHPPAA